MGVSAYVRSSAEEARLGGQSAEHVRSYLLSEMIVMTVVAMIVAMMVAIVVMMAPPSWRGVAMALGMI